MIRYELRTVAVVATVRQPELEAHGAAQVQDYGALRGIFAALLAGEADDQEHLFLLTLDAGLRPLGFARIASGGLCGVGVEPGLVFRRALMLGGRALALAHNHPSGQVTPSAADCDFTERVAKGAALLGLELLDHLILAGERCCSMRYDIPRVWESP